ncbi:MAG: hypothetical protein AABY47_05650 [Pseudomonadota bacterium]
MPSITLTRFGGFFVACCFLDATGVIDKVRLQNGCNFQERKST